MEDPESEFLNKCPGWFLMGRQAHTPHFCPSRAAVPQVCAGGYLSGLNIGIPPFWLVNICCPKSLGPPLPHAHPSLSPGLVQLRGGCLPAHLGYSGVYFSTEAIVCSDLWVLTHPYYQIFECHSEYEYISLFRSPPLEDGKDGRLTHVYIAHGPRA